VRPRYGSPVLEFRPDRRLDRHRAGPERPEMTYGWISCVAAGVVPRPPPEIPERCLTKRPARQSKKAARAGLLTGLLSRNVLRCDQLQIDGDRRLDFLTAERGYRRQNAKRADAIRLLGDRGRQTAIAHGRKRVVNGVETDENDALAPRSFRRLNRAQDHLVVVREHTIDLRLRLQNVLEHRQPFGPVEVRRLPRHHLDARAVLAQ